MAPLSLIILSSDFAWFHVDQLLSHRAMAQLVDGFVCFYFQQQWDPYFDVKLNLVVVIALY